MVSKTQNDAINVLPVGVLILQYICVCMCVWLVATQTIIPSTLFNYFSAIFSHARISSLFKRVLRQNPPPAPCSASLYLTPHRGTLGNCNAPLLHLASTSNSWHFLFWFFLISASLFKNSRGIICFVGILTLTLWCTTTVRCKAAWSVLCKITLWT